MLREFAVYRGSRCAFVMRSRDDEPLDDEEPFTADWREAAEHRYGAASTAGSGRINPVFRKLGVADRRFGVQLLVVAAVIVLLPVFGLRHWPFYYSLLLIAAILIIGGVANLRATPAPGRSGGST